MWRWIGVTTTSAILACGPKAANPTPTPSTATATASTSTAAASSATPSATGSDTRPIGAATMLADGTLVMQLRAEGPHGEVGDAQLTYAPSHEDYKKMLDHLGGMKPGESKPVPPFP